MKIIRPEPIKTEKKPDNIPVIVIPEPKQDLSLIDSLMQQTLDENKIKVEFTLTKIQHEQWNKKGGVSWLKRTLAGQKYENCRIIER